MERMGETMELKPIIRHNKDDINAAVDGLSQFCHSFCMNVAETEKQDDLVFRCAECQFLLDGEYCAIKKFLNAHGTPEQIDAATAMGSL